MEPTFAQRIAAPSGAGQSTISGWPRRGAERPAGRDLGVTIVRVGAAGRCVRQGRPPALASPAAGALVVVGDAVWAAIAARVELVRATAAGSGLPGSVALLAACEQWRAMTLPALVAQAELLGADCDAAVRMFAALANGSARPARAAAAVGAARQASVARRDALTMIAAQVARLRDAGACADAQIARYVMAIGPRWSALTAPVAQIDDATASALAAEVLLTADLAELEQSPSQLRDTDVRAALTTWRRLAARSRSFAAARRAELRRGRP